LYKRLFVCINSLSYQWTPTGAVKASVSGAQMLNRLYRTISPHKSHMKHVCHHQDVYTICVSPFTTRCCTVAIRNLRKLYPNDVTKFGQLMQHCKLVTIHRNTTTGDVITAVIGVRRCSFNCYTRSGTMLIK